MSIVLHSVSDNMLPVLSELAYVELHIMPLQDHTSCAASTLMWTIHRIQTFRGPRVVAIAAPRPAILFTLLGFESRSMHMLHITDCISSTTKDEIKRVTRVIGSYMSTCDQGHTCRPSLEIRHNI